MTTEDLQRIATLVAEIDKLDPPTTAAEIHMRLRRIQIARVQAARRATQLLADIEALRAKVHAVRNEDAAMLASADLESTHLRRGVLDALDVFALDLPCEEACLRMAARLRAALAAAESGAASGDRQGA